MSDPDPRAEGPLAPSPRVQHLEVSNPFILDLIGAAIPWTVAVTALTVVSTQAKSFSEEYRNYQQLKLAKDDNRRSNELHQYELESKKISVLRENIELIDFIKQLDPEVKDRYGLNPRGIETRPLKRAEALKNQTIEAAIELQKHSTEEIEFEVFPPDDDDTSGPV